MNETAFRRIPDGTVHVIIAADHNHLFFRRNDSGNIPEVLFCRLRLVFEDQSGFRHAMFCQDIAHDGSFRPAGPVCIILPDGTERKAALSGGAIKVSPAQTAILANAVEWAEDIDIDWAKRSEQDALRRKENSKSNEELQFAEMKLQRALNRLRVSSSMKD